MSTWIASDRHIASLAAYYTEDPVERQRIATLLKRENINSFNYRYAEKVRRTKCSLKNIEVLTAVDAYSLATSLDYNSYDHPSFSRTEAYEILQEILRMAALYSPTPVEGKNGGVLGRWSI